MNKGVKIMCIVCVLFFLLTSFCGCDFLKEYHEDIVYELPEERGTLIIKEWSFLLGDGAEIYYKRDFRAMVHLGNTIGSDDGQCPFTCGRYEITMVDENTIHISWDRGTGAWLTDVFEIPENLPL